MRVELRVHHGMGNDRATPCPLLCRSYGSGQQQGCASLELGVATVDYSTDYGVTWQELRTYERNK